MDPAAAATDTESALRSALDAAYRERESLTQRLDEVDQLIADLSQAAEGSGEAPTRQRRAPRPASRTGTKTAAKKGTKKSGAKTAKKGTKASGRKSAKRAQRKATTKRAAKRATGASTTRRGSGGDGIGRTDRVVYLIAGADQPLSTGEVRSQLSNYEPDVTSKLVSASLSYAERKGRIRRTEDGRWVPVDAQGSREAASTG